MKVDLGTQLCLSMVLFKGPVFLPLTLMFVFSTSGWDVSSLTCLHMFPSIATASSSRLQSCIQQRGEDSELRCYDAHPADPAAAGSGTGNPLVDRGNDPNGTAGLGHLLMVIPVLTACHKTKICKD